MERLVVVVRGGMVEDIYAEGATEVELMVVDYDARELADDDDDRVSLVDGEHVWVTGHPAVVDAWFVSRVFQAWV